MQNQSVRAPADRLRQATQVGEHFLERIAPHWQRADAVECMICLENLRHALRIAPNTAPRKVLIARGKVVARALALALHELRNHRAPYPQVANAPPVALDLPDTDAPRDVESPPVLVVPPADPDAPLTPALSDSAIYKAYRRLDGSYDKYEEARRKARKAYNATGAGTVTRRKYLASPKGKAMRKAANARYYAKRKEKESHHD